jgi:transposase
MIAYVGLDLSLEATAVCMIDEQGKVLKERSVESSPEAVASLMVGSGFEIARVGLEACPLSEWIYQGLAERGFNVVCIETRRLKAFLDGQINKTDRNDARGIAQAVRVNLFQAVHVKSRASQRARALLSVRRLVVTQHRQVENQLRALFKSDGLKVGTVRRKDFAARVEVLRDEVPELAPIVDSLLQMRTLLLSRLDALDAMVRAIVREDPVCQLLMTAPGVGPLVSLTFKTAMDVPGRFRRSRAVGAYFGLTPRRYQSGEQDRSGRISKVGDGAVRAALYEAANVLLRPRTRRSTLKAWGMAISRRRGRKRAVVAVARRLATILHRMWMNAEAFKWNQQPVNP